MRMRHGSLRSLREALSGLYKFTRAGEQFTSNRALSLSQHAESLSMSLQHPAQIPLAAGHQVSATYPFTTLTPPLFPGRPGTSILIDCCSEDSLTVDSYDYAHRRTSRDIRSRCRRQLITFDILPDDVLLEMFDFYMDVDEDIDEESEKQRIQEWITLTHVCRRWRRVVFQSPLRLNLRLVCTPFTPAKDTLDIWPPLPLIIRDFYSIGRGRFIEDNIIAALEHNDRVCEIGLTLLELGYFTNSAVILKPFPELTDLKLSNFEGPEAILPDSFLGGTAPRLRSLILREVPFPGLPKLLLSATHLVKLDLSLIPRSGYIPPEVMAINLSALTSLEFLHLRFRYPPPRPALQSRRPPPPPFTRSILPNLTEIQFKGTSEYLEEILARIDAPRLDKLDITFFNQIIFDTPQLFQFISRTPTLMAPEKCYVAFNPAFIIVKFTSRTSDYDMLYVGILCTASEWQLSSVEQVCTSSLPPVYTLEDLYISEYRYGRERPHWQKDVEDTLWLDLLRSFVAVKNIHISETFVPRIAPALQELVGERTTEVLPALENIFLEGFQPSGFLYGLEKFVAARQLTRHPVAVSPLYRNRHREIFGF